MLSMVFHAILILIIIFSLNNVTSRDGEVGVSVISSHQFSQICPDHKRNIESKLKNLNFFKSPNKDSFSKDEKEGKVKEQKQKINDLAYTTEVYKIGSKQNPPPSYPRVAKLRNLQGKVEICIISDAYGHVVSAEIHKTSGYSILDNSALKTVKNWRLDIKKASQDVAQNQFFRVIVPISFVMN